MENFLDDTQPIQVTDNIWWTGFADFESGFSNNSYLYKAGKESVLIDPGPAHPVFRDIIVRKIRDIVSLEDIRYIVLLHQDPDICGLVPYIENMLHPELTIICHPRTALFIPYYGIRRGILPVGDEDALVLPENRKLVFYHLPYLHFSGNLAVFDPASASLFSSDIFALFDRSWNFYIDKSSLEKCRGFIENYFGSREALLYAYKKLKKLNPRIILPQHGGVIKKDVDDFIELLKQSQPARALETVDKPSSDIEEKKLLEISQEWYADWSNKTVRTSSLENLYSEVLKEGPAATSLFLEIIEKNAREMGIRNPLLSGRVFSSKNLRETEPSTVIYSARRRYMQKFYSQVPFESSDTLKEGFNSFKTDMMIVFIDIRKFTRWCEDKKPDQVMNLLNQQHGLIAKHIENSGGRINKILGDGVLAYYPMNLIEDAIEALFEVHELIAGNKLLPVGIGCDFGPVIIGDIGRESRLDYTLIGQAVNLAARLCDSTGPEEITFSNNIRKNVSESFWQKLLEQHSHTQRDIRVKPHDPAVESFVFQAS